MIEIRTYIKSGDEFYDVFTFEGPLDDVDYIDGALELTINGVNLINKEMYDYIDQLWAYISEGLVNLFNGKSYKVFFPDQPIEIEFLPIKNDGVLISIYNNKIFYNKNDFLNVMSKHAKSFFERLILIEPSLSPSCSNIIKDLEGI